MDHKEFFDLHGDTVVARNIVGDFDVEDLYEAFKQRLIEELRVPEPSPFPFLEGKQKLIDTGGGE